MAGFSKIYCVGGLGGFEGADGVNPILFQILVGESDRQWFQVHYFDATIKPIGKIETLIPEKPHAADVLLDACIAFFPLHFQACPSLAPLQTALKDVKCLDFNSDSSLQMSEIASRWENLRMEALPMFHALTIWQADLKLMTL